LLSAKALPSAALGKGPSANFESAKGSLPRAFYRALGKGFAECLLGGTRQRKVTVMTGCKLTVALPSVSKKGTRQIIFLKTIPNFFAECLQVGHSAKKLIFLFKKFFAECPARRHSAKKFRIFLKKFFAECLEAGHSAKKLIFLFKKFFAQCLQAGHSAKKLIFLFKKFFAECSAGGALGKAGNPTGSNGHFTECNFPGTRQSDQNRPIYLIFTFSRDKQNISHIFHILQRYLIFVT